MAYQKQTWRNLPDRTTPITAARLEHMETQYDEVMGEVVPELELKATYEYVDSVAFGGDSGNVKAYGAEGDGVTDDGPALQLAIDSNPKVFLPEGVYLTNQTLRLPSDFQMTGVGIGSSVILAGPALDNVENVITNELNNESYRTEYNRNIYLADFTVDGNFSNRPGSLNQPRGWNGRASNIFFSTVEHATVERVESVRGALHNFCIDASAMPTTEGPTFYPPGPSRYVTLRKCVSRDQSADDGFTTHFSHDILIEDCVATHSSASSIYPDKAQNGFEVDDGSYRVTVRGCYAEGHAIGFQVKSHGIDYAPVRDTLISDCTAYGCAVGYETSNSGSIAGGPMEGRGSSLIFENCRYLSPVEIPGPTNNKLFAMRLMTSQNVIVRNFTSRDSPYGGIIVSAGSVTIDGVRGERVWTAPDCDTQGFIRFVGDYPGGGVVRDVEVTNIVSGPIIWQSATGGDVDLRVSGIKARGAASFPCVSDSYINQNRTYEDIKSQLFSAPIDIRGGGGANRTIEQYGPFTIMGGGSPNSAIVGKPGWICTINTSAGTHMWVKDHTTGNTGWISLGV